MEDLLIKFVQRTPVKHNVTVQIRDFIEHFKSSIMYNWYTIERNPLYMLFLFKKDSLLPIGWVCFKQYVGNYSIDGAISVQVNENYQRQGFDKILIKKLLKKIRKLIVKNCVKLETIHKYKFEPILKKYKIRMYEPSKVISQEIVAQNLNQDKSALTNQFRKLSKLAPKEEKTKYRRAVRALNKLNLDKFKYRKKTGNWDAINIPTNLVKEFFKKGRIRLLYQLSRKQGKKPTSKKTSIPRKNLKPVVDYIISILKARKIEPVGSWRRGLGRVKDLDFLISGLKPEFVLEKIERSRKLKVLQVLWSGDQKIGLHVEAIGFDGVKNFQLEFKFTPLKYWGASLLESTGSSSFNIFLRTKASRKKMKLNNKGLWKDGKLIAYKKEEDIFEALGLGYVDPIHRTGWV